ncbi:MSC_0623 family F1-like ATPase-associated protein [Mycoplasmopsis meleagridis]|uniref:MSC_0623 family F1-like ATPase-associated protein n=1 Tax=Mycoplasmopsis meleagridis TaxID=29561 RepID=UPI003A851A30
MFKKMDDRLKNNHKNKKILKYLEGVEAFQTKLYSDYVKLTRSTNFVDNNAFLNTLALEYNLENVDVIKNQLTSWIKSKRNLVLDRFTLTFTRDNRFSNTTFVPALNETPSSKVLDIDFKSTANEDFKAFNSYLYKLLDANFIVEILDGIILVKNLNTYKILFGQGLFDE